MLKHRLHVIGISPGASLPNEQSSVLESCGVVFTTPRLQKHLARYRGPVMGLSPLDRALSGMRQYLEETDIAVVVGGDPLFFGIGRKLCAEFGSDCINIYPAVTSMQVAFSRLRKPWNEVHFVSLHGRSIGSLAPQVLPFEQVCLLTGGANTPRIICRRLLEEGISGYHAWVFENLGETDERITEGDLARISQLDFSEMSVLVLERVPDAPSFLPFGLTESEILHSRGLITKDEVRAAVLHRLRLPARGVFWDIGAGSGSISLEASRVCPDLDIRMVERNPSELKNIQANLKRYASKRVILIEGEAPEACEGLPRPDRVFVGGSGGRLEEILHQSIESLKPHGRIVLTAVTSSTARKAPAILMSHGLKVCSSSIRVQRTCWTSSGEETSDLNPVSVILGSK